VSDWPERSINRLNVDDSMVCFFNLHYTRAAAIAVYSMPD
jgi:hypothetical protein